MSTHTKGSCVSYFNNTNNFANHKDTVIKAGTVILTCKPFAYSLGYKFANSRCDTCFRSDINLEENDQNQLLRCGGCQLVRYCGRDCQRIGWYDGHKWECKGFKAFKRIPAAFARLIVRIIVKLNSGKDYYDDLTPKVRRRFKDLVSHYGDVKQDPERLDQSFTMAKVAESILALQGISMPNESEIIKICGRLFVNTFNILDYEGHVLGTGLYLGASIFDHSCEPMAVANFESNTISIRTIKDIPPGVSILKITICYKDTIRPSALRINELKKCYYFECQCERCSQKIDDIPMTTVRCPNRKGNCRAEINVHSNKQCPECHEKFSEEYVKQIIETEEMARLRWAEMCDVAFVDVCETCLRVMSSLNFSESNWLMVCMASGAFDAYVDRQCWEKAYHYGKMMLIGFRRYYYEIHPILGVALLKMAKLAWFLENEKEAKQFILEAKKVLDITHGTHHPFVVQSVMPLAKEIAMCSRHLNGFK